MFLFYFLSFTWGSIMTVLGLLFLSIFKLLRWRKIDLHIIAGRIAMISKTRLPGSVSLGIVYLTDYPPDKNLRIHVHEMGHSIQNAYMGPFFIPLVAIPSFIRASLWPSITKKYFEETGQHLDYDSIWFEGQATKLGMTYIKPKL